MNSPPTKLSKVVIRFAGDSGDGIQLIGSEFTKSAALAHNDLGTFPDFPAEIRAPAGTVAGVSGFQIQFSSEEIHTPGDQADVLVVMNAAALRKNLSYLKLGGTIIANEDGFDNKNLRLAGYADGENPLMADLLSPYILHQIPVTRLTKEALVGTGMGTRDADRSKNMFVLGLIYWLYGRTPDTTVNFIQRKFAKEPTLAEANERILRAGYAYGETTEAFGERFEVGQAQMKPGFYRGITGNLAASLGLIAATHHSGLKLFYGTYPITPASDILHELARHKNFGVTTFQAEDEISAVCAALGASYGGSLGVTASSGPGLDLKAEAIGLALMLELPLVIIDVQRAGPSTGMPTKTEQSDLLMAMYGRHGEAPLPIIAAKSPAHCFEAIYEACRVAVEHMTPVFFLSDAYLANGSEPWRFPQSADLKPINPPTLSGEARNGEKYYPYKRDERGVRSWALPGTPGLENRIGGLEKEALTGNISYDAANHERMVKIRAQKVADIARHIPLAKLDSGPDEGPLLLLSWGSTYGTVKTASMQLQAEGHPVAHLHLEWLNPFPSNLGEILRSYERVLIPENNSGHLLRLIRAEYLIPAVGYHKIQGLPIGVSEILDQIYIHLKQPAHAH